jgi:hypothetical protein
VFVSSRRFNHDVARLRSKIHDQSSVEGTIERTDELTRCKTHDVVMSLRLLHNVRAKVGMTTDSKSLVWYAGV